MVREGFCARLQPCPYCDDDCEGKMDALELDVLLSEVTLMHTRAELYWRFLRRRVGDSPQQKAQAAKMADAPTRRSIEVRGLDVIVCEL